MDYAVPNANQGIFKVKHDACHVLMDKNFSRLMKTILKSVQRPRMRRILREVQEEAINEVLNTAQQVASR